MESLSLSRSFELVAEESAQMAAAVNAALDRYESSRENLSFGKAIRETELLLATLHRGAFKARNLAKGVPGPNRVPGILSSSVAEVTNALFNFAASCEDRERTILGNVLSQS
jgi:hypothetical protein